MSKSTASRMLVPSGVGIVVAERGSVLGRIKVGLYNQLCINP
jgi:hypothetical protein